MRRDEAWNVSWPLRLSARPPQFYALSPIKKKSFIKRKQLFPFSPLQVLLGPIWPEREEEAAAHQDHVHQLPAEGAGARVRRDSLPGHLHPGGAGAEDRPDRGPSTGVPSGF